MSTQPLSTATPLPSFQSKRVKEAADQTVIKGEKSTKSIAYWLFACCVCIALMVWIGGVTRLTGSGLSMTDWKPVTGFIPPLNQQDWQNLFDSYRQSPEYMHINKGMDLEGFKGIFWLEFIHRVMGRITGLVFFVPLLFFVVTRRVNRPLALKLGGILLLGATQGVIGWLMVSSGLKDVPHVSQYWLAFHLSMAFLLFALVFLLGLSIYNESERQPRQSMIAVASDRKLVKRCTYGLTALVMVQVILGAFVAGLDAGLIYNTFPDMNGYMIPPDLLFFEPWYRNFTENLATVQFTHRVGAYVVTASVVLFAWLMWKHPLTRSVNIAVLLLLFTTAIQMALGIATLLYHVPVGLASAHQMGALALFSVMLFLSYQCSSKETVK